MTQKETQKNNFGNWVSAKLIIIPGLLGVIFFGLGTLHWSFYIGAGLFLVFFIYIGISSLLFSAKGGNLQNQVQELVLDHIDWNGKGRVLDIGCGNAPLTIKIAQRYHEAEVIGIDYWSKRWDYSMESCVENARLSGVDGRVTFRRASASALPFEDASFDLIVSNLVFHEVRDVDDKRKPIHEALRVLKPGGAFVLQDLFLLRPYYGTPEELIDTIQGWGISNIEFLRTCDEPFIPVLLKLPFMLGSLALLRGKK